MLQQPVLRQQTAGTWCCSSRYQLLLLLLLLWASQQQKEVVVHQSARKRLGRGDGVAKLCGQLNCVAHALAEGIQNVKQFFSWTKKKHVSIYAFTF